MANTVLMFLATATCFCSVVVLGKVTLDSGTMPLNKDFALYQDCGQLQKAGHNKSGPYILHMNNTLPFLIHCEFTKDNAYNVIQRRASGVVNFVQPLSTYRTGFGNVQTDYWAGLDLINHLTMTMGNHVLTIIMQDWGGNNRNARYSSFVVHPYANAYRMYVSGFSGSVPDDDFSYHSGMPFHTYDKPDTNNCAVHLKAGWWYNYCAYTLLNGHYYIGGSYTPTGGYFDGMFWKDWFGPGKSFGYSLKFVSMSVSTS